MIEKTEIVNLCVDSVTIRRQKIYTDGDVEYKVGKPTCTSYSNSVSGRKDITKNIKEPFLGAIMLVWGSSPTVVVKQTTVDI